MNREDWHAAVHEVAKSWIQLSDWTKLNWNTTLKGSAHDKLSQADMCYGDLKQDFFCTSWSTCYKSNTAVSPNMYFHLEYYHPYLGWLLPVQTSLTQRGISLTNYLGMNCPPTPYCIYQCMILCFVFISSFLSPPITEAHTNISSRRIWTLSTLITITVTAIPYPFPTHAYSAIWQGTT